MFGESDSAIITYCRKITPSAASARRLHVLDVGESVTLKDRTVSRAALTFFKDNSLGPFDRPVIAWTFAAFNLGYLCP